MPARAAAGFGPIPAMASQRAIAPARLGPAAWLLTAFLAAAAAIPTSYVYVLERPPFFASSFDVIVVAVGVLAVLCTCLGLINSPAVALLAPTGVLLAWATWGVFQSRPAGMNEALCLYWPMLVFSATPFAAGACTWVNRRNTVALVRLLARFIVFVVLLYTAMMYLAPLLGVREHSHLTTRIGGPLGNAAMLHIVFLPAFAAFIEEPTRLARCLYAPLCMIALVLTFSRASLLAVSLYMAYLLLSSSSISGRHKMIALAIGSMLSLSLSWLWDDETAARTLDFSDDSRFTTLNTALEAWLEAPWFGHGYSAVWPFWQRTGELLVGLAQDRWDGLYVETPWGPSLWNPHSLVLYLSGEMGLIGLLTALSVIVPLLRTCLRSFPMRGLAVALAISFLVDAATAGSFVAYPVCCFIWWTWCLCAILNARRPAHLPASRSLGNQLACAS